MPELPEVQTIVDDLNKKIKGWKIVGFWTEWGKAIKPSAGGLEKEIIEKKILRIERRAKNILFFLSGGKVMLVHLKMTGHLLVKDEKGVKDNHFFRERVNQYIRHRWQLENGKKELVLEFSDLRKFGKIELFGKEDLARHKSLSSLGIEPLSAGFTVEKLGEIFSKRKNQLLRVVLLDQSLIAGIGNIYASEIPFEAGVSPIRKAGSLEKIEIKELHRQTKKVLEKAVRMRGTSDSDFRDTEGAPGGFQKMLKVYNRENGKCLRKGCAGIIQRRKVAQRSAFFCEICQK